MSIYSEIINPSAVTIGSNLTYEFTLTNLGPDTVDLSDFPGDQFGINNLVTGVLPTDILYFGNVDDSDIVCNGSGAGSASMFGAALGNHSDNEIIVCSWAGSSRFLEAGQSFTFSFEATVQPASDLVFDAYFIVPPSPSSDPDSTDINNILTSGSDIIDQFLATDINNFSVAEFPVPVVQEVIPAPDSVGSGSLALSGTSLYLSVVALFIALLGFALLFVQKRRRFIYES